MTPFIILDSVDFIQIPVTDTRVYFPASSHLLGKNIQAITLNMNPFGTDITGNFDVLPPGNCFITLFDTDGNLIFDKLPLFMIASEIETIYEINKKVDFERSYIDVKNVPETESTLFFNIFISEEYKQKEKIYKQHYKTLLFAGVYISGCAINEQEKIYSLSFQTGNQPIDISFKGIYALTGKKIYRISLTSQGNHVNGYFLIVPKEEGRYINNLALSNLYGGFTTDKSPRFIKPLEINFDRTYLYIRPTSEAEDNVLTINFYYE